MTDSFQRQLSQFLQIEKDIENGVTFPCGNCERHIPVSYSAYVFCHHCGAGHYRETMVDPPGTWNTPSQAEVEYARATMPGKASGHVIGWRVWKINNGKLGSTSIGCHWKPQEPMIGQTALSSHPFAYGPGIYAFKDAGDIIVALRGQDLPPSLVTGKVALWGYISEHEQGYRARYAYPTELKVSSRLNDRVRASLEDQYKVSTGTMQTLATPRQRL